MIFDHRIPDPDDELLPLELLPPDLDDFPFFREEQHPQDHQLLLLDSLSPRPFAIRVPVHTHTHTYVLKMQHKRDNRASQIG